MIAAGQQFCRVVESPLRPFPTQTSFESSQACRDCPQPIVQQASPLASVTPIGARQCEAVSATPAAGGLPSTDGVDVAVVTDRHGGPWFGPHMGADLTIAEGQHCDLVVESPR